MQLRGRGTLLFTGTTGPTGSICGRGSRRGDNGDPHGQDRGIRFRLRQPRYLAFTKLPVIAAQTGAAIVWRPMLLGGVFKATGNSSPVAVSAKGRWMFNDIARCARRYGVPLAFYPHFPVKTLTLMHGAAGLLQRRPAGFGRCCTAVFSALCQQQMNLGDPAVLAAVLLEAGFDTEAFSALVADPEVKAARVATTEDAVARGVFGAPTFVVGEPVFFGHDRGSTSS